jgi:hypothetical protein
MIYEYEIHGVPLRTGDLICTTDGAPDLLPGEFWRLIGLLLPGDVDHVVIYLGPGGRCAESSGRGVITFEVSDGCWQCEKLILERGLLVDTFYGVVYPLQGLGLSGEEERRIREDIAAYCLAQVGKPYNLNFLDAEREDAFYCTQLAYKAYQRHGINLNTGLDMSNLPGSDLIIFPQEIWNGFPHRRAAADQEVPEK